MSGPGIPSVPRVPQRCVIVLPTTGEYDSRTYRIASTLAARGHEVTVLARLAPGQPASRVEITAGGCGQMMPNAGSSQRFASQAL